MIADDHELFGFLAPADHADHAAKRGDALLVLHVHLERHRSRPDVVLERQCALPFGGRLRTLSCFRIAAALRAFNGMEGMRGNCLSRSGPSAQ